MAVFDFCFVCIFNVPSERSAAAVGRAKSIKFDSTSVEVRPKRMRVKPGTQWCGVYLALHLFGPGRLFEGHRDIAEGLLSMPTMIGRICR